MRLAQTVLAFGVGAALLGDLLFQDSGLGLNLFLWLAPVLAAGLGFYYRSGGRDRRLPWIVALMLFFVWCLAWRASPFLRFWNVAAIIAAAILAVTALRCRLGQAWLPDYVKGAVHLAARIGLGAIEAAAAVWSGGSESAIASRVRKVGVGLVLAVPLFVVFASLLAEADPLFEKFLDGIFSWQPSEFLDHAALILVLGWIALGWLRLMVAPPGPAGGGQWRLPIALGPIEVGIPLGVLALLLAAFVGLQSRYLFGGEAVLRSSGLTYAEFARRGFFELVTVAALVVPLLYGAQWVLDRTVRGAVQSFRALASLLGVLVALVMVSALGRMRLYVEAYGLTEERLYAAVFMIWIGVVLGWFVLTELRSQQRRFMTGAVVAGFAVLVFLNFLNPDGLVAKVNLERGLSGQALDVEYLGQLSADAVPAVAAAWPHLDSKARCELRRTLFARAVPVRDWREWNWGVASAARRVGGLDADDGCEAIPAP
ncbi:MAG: hypothetical protein KatS3mg081_1671 [Gemmatimonadales bacterium]|nr:MAG: hypothetical protein KatS3mg081_1671 [Gemmatimonadales bacterium]